LIVTPAVMLVRPMPVPRAVLRDAVKVTVPAMLFIANVVPVIETMLL